LVDVGHCRQATDLLRTLCGPATTNFLMYSDTGAYHCADGLNRSLTCGFSVGSRWHSLTTYGHPADFLRTRNGLTTVLPNVMAIRAWASAQVGAAASVAGVGPALAARVALIPVGGAGLSRPQAQDVAIRRRFFAPPNVGPTARRPAAGP
jgi:hypothetical protein